MAQGNEEVIGMVVKLAAESTGFQEEMSSLNRQMKVLQSEYKATSSTSKNFESTMEGMTAKSEYLNNALKTQQSIVDAHATRLEKSKQRLSELAEAQMQLKAKLDSTKASLDEAVRLHGEESQEAQKLSSELKELQAQYDQNNTRVNALSRTIDNQSISYNNARSTLNNFEGQLRDTETAMQQMGNASDDVNNDMNNLRGTGNPFSQFTGGVKDALGQTKIFGVSLGDIGGALTGAINPTTLLAGAVAGATEAFTQFIIEGIQKAIQAIGEFIKQTVDLGNQFQAQMSKVEALSGATGSSVVKLTDAARKMGKESVYSAKEAAQGLEYMALAGWSAEDSIKGLPDVLNLAASSGMELGRASDIVTDYLTAFGMQIEDTTRLVDVMAYAMSHSNTDTDQLGEAYKNCAATCATFGLNVEETTSWLAKMADAGIKGGEAGTALNSVLSRLYGQNEKTNKAMQQYGLSMYEANGKAKPFTQTMQELEDAMKDMTEQQQFAFLRSVAGTQQLSAFSTMLRASAKEAGNFAKELENSAGSAEKMARVMNNNVEGLKKSINSKMEDIKLSIYTAIEPIISMVLKVVETITNSVSNFMKPIGDFIGALLTPIKEIFNAIMDIFQILNNKFSELNSGVLRIITSTLQVIGQIIGDLCNLIVGAVEIVSSLLDPIINVIDTICGAIGRIGDAISGVINTFTSKVGSFIDEVSNKINEKHNEMIDGMVTKYAEANNLTKEQTEQLRNEVLSKFDEMNGGISKAFEKLNSESSESFKNIAEACGESTDKVWESFEEMYKAIQELDDETYSELKASAEKYKGEFEGVMGAVDDYESDMLKKKMDKWESTHKSMEGTLSWYTKRAEYEAEQQEKISSRTADTRERINKQYTSKLEVEFKKQQQVQESNISDNAKNYQKDYSEFAKNEEAKTKKLQDEVNKRKKMESSSSTGGILSGLKTAFKIPGYAVGTSNHPGGLAIVGERGPELANIPRGTSVATHNDTSNMLRNANIDVVNEVSGLRSDVNRLINQIARNSREQTALLGLN